MFSLLFLLDDIWEDVEPDPYLWLTDPDADPGGAKNIRILRIRMRIRTRKTDYYLLVHFSVCTYM